MTSAGSTLPREARPTVRISNMVMTIVASTTAVALKVRDISLRMEEWNNIDGNERRNYEL